MIGLPNFNFKPVITPFVKAPVEALNNTVNTLNQNYDTSLDNLSKLRQAQAALQAAPFDKDRELLENTISTFNDRYGEISERPDLENATVLTKRLLSDFSEKAIPIAQRNKQIKEELDKIKANPNIKDKERAINAFKLQENLNPTLQEIDGSIINNFDASQSSFLYTPQVNLNEIVNSALQGVKEGRISLSPRLVDLKNQNGETVGELIQSGRIDELEEDQVRAIALNALDSNQDVQNFKERERRFGELGQLAQESEITDGVAGLEDNFTNQFDAALEFAREKFPFKRTDLNYSQFKTNDPNDGSGGKNNPIDSISNTRSLGTSVGNESIISPKELKGNISIIQEKIKNGEGTPYDVAELNRLARINEITLVKTNEILGDTFSSEEKELLSNYSNITDLQISKALAPLDLDGNIKGELASMNITPYQNDIDQVRTLRNRVSKEQQEQLKNLYKINSVEPEIIDYNDTKTTGFEKSSVEAINNKVISNIGNYHIITQDGQSLEDLMSELSEEEKERITDLSSSNGSISEIGSNVNIFGQTSVPIKDGTVGLVAKIGGKYSSVLGKQVYLVPRNGYDSNIFRYVMERKAINPKDPKNRVEQIISTELPVDVANRLESSFQGYIKHLPNIYNEGESNKITFDSRMPTIEYKKQDGYFVYKFIDVDGSESEESKATNFKDIRQQYYLNLDN